ncbi:hypothetical protein [Planosporangium mesophilum]|uniref:Transcriptional regulator n=1 Tax=Planosporangium mesophilum TaxID=689768 RepID=A0A8J3TB78_9ACTN|nr:hypothetical protein [Planosporangium mesophilum]NJC84515.1 hypothetical protein [Planosporangium mesophilum]GII23338.1 hypothetical protein Pme01_29350 [Planosporangium mesophilum]
MRLSKAAANPCLAALIEGAGFPSLERFALSVNDRGWRMHHVKLSYDHVSVKRWLLGRTCQYPDVVAAVLSEAWGVPIPVPVIWPELREGACQVPAHLQAWVAARTLEDLGVFLRSDMLTRREMLAGSIRVATGAALADPIVRWLNTNTAGPLAHAAEATARIGISTVEGIEQATRQFAASDAEVGGGLSREAAVGQLKYAVDLARHASYGEAVGKRLLAAIANLSGLVGWMSFDADMDGPAQRYFLYGLQAAHEVGDERTALRASGILADMAHQMRALGHPDTGLRLIELALDRVPSDRRRFNAVRAMLWSLKANMLSPMGLGYLAEIRAAVSLSFDLYDKARDDEPDPAVAEYWPYTSDSELAYVAAGTFRDLDVAVGSLANDSERYAQYALAHRGDGFVRSKVFDQIALARVRFLMAEPDEACRNGEAAIDLAAAVAASKRVTTRLREMLADSQPYVDRPNVREFRERLELAVS